MFVNYLYFEQPKLVIVVVDFTKWFGIKVIIRSMLVVFQLEAKLMVILIN